MFLCKAWVMFKTSGIIIFSSKITHTMLEKEITFKYIPKKKKYEKVAQFFKQMTHLFHLFTG